MTTIFQRNLCIDGTSMGKTHESIYESLILNELHFVAKTNTGYCVLHSLHTSNRSVRIVPSLILTADKSNAGPVNWNDATYPCRPIRSGSGAKIASSYPFGTGVGSDVIIEHNPFIYQVQVLASTLTHELTHAAEEVHGKLVCNPLGWQFDTQADLMRYSCRTSSTPKLNQVLVRDHDSGMPLASPLMLPKPAFIRLLQSFRARMPALAQHLGDVTAAAYNPLRKGAIGYVGVQGDMPGSLRYL